MSHTRPSRVTAAKTLFDDDARKRFFFEAQRVFEAYILGKHDAIGGREIGRLQPFPELVLANPERFPKRAQNFSPFRLGTREKVGTFKRYPEGGNVFRERLVPAVEDDAARRGLEDHLIRIEERPLGIELSVGYAQRDQTTENEPAQKEKNESAHAKDNGRKRQLERIKIARPQVERGLLNVKLSVFHSEAGHRRASTRQEKEKPRVRHRATLLRTGPGTKTGTQDRQEAQKQSRQLRREARFR